MATDRAIYAAVADRYSGYIKADPKLSPEQKARRLRTVYIWCRTTEGWVPSSTAEVSDE